MQGAAAVEEPAEDYLSNSSQISTLSGHMKALRRRDWRRMRAAAAAAAVAAAGEEKAAACEGGAGV